MDQWWYPTVSRWDLIIAETMPLEPEEIIFNDLNGVLAEDKEADWDDFL